MIHSTDADVYARGSRGAQTPYIQQDDISRCRWMERIYKYHLVAVALIVRGLNDGRLCIHVKQDRRNGIAIRRDQFQDGRTEGR